MAETKTSISELTAATSVGSDDLLFISQLSGSTWNSKKATVGQLPFGQGTITGITMNGESKGTSGNVDLGTVLTGVPTSYKTYSDTVTQLGTDGYKTYAATKTQLSTDGFKTYSDTKTQLGTDGFKTYADTKTALDSVYKPLQTAKTDPTASGNTTSFIDTISQDANGVITATKKSVQAATTSVAGIVQLNNTLTSTSTTQAATANAVKTAYDGCLKNNVDSQTMDGVRTLSFTSTYAFPDDSYTVDTFINNFYFNDLSGYNLANLNTRQTKAGNALLQLSIKAPFGDDSADIQSYLRLFVYKAGKYAYVSVPTPPSNSNGDVVATTEWVRNALNTRIPQSTVSATTLQLKNQTQQGIQITTAGTYVFVPPEPITNVSRHYYLYVSNTSSSNITVKFSRTNPGETTASVTYYTDELFTPITSIAARAGYVYEFFEFARNAIKVTQQKIVIRTSLGD